MAWSIPILSIVYLKCTYNWVPWGFYCLFDCFCFFAKSGNSIIQEVTCNLRRERVRAGKEEEKKRKENQPPLPHTRTSLPKPS